MLDFIHFDYLILLRLVAAVILGGIIGFERGGNKHDAGLRTHIIVCLGAASIMVVSECLVKQYGGSTDIMRMGAQVISGVGFLGVGSIIFDGNKVRGITTAAGLWTTACVGLVVGSGYYIIAGAVVGLMLFAMLGLRPLTQKLKYQAFIFNIKMELDNVNKIQSVVKKLLDDKIELVSTKLDVNGEKVDMILEVRLQDRASVEKLWYSLSDLGGVKEIAEV